MLRIAALLLAGFGALASAEDICMPPCEGDVCTLTTMVDLFAGELGYYKFEECGDATNPTIGVMVGKTYKFSQADRSNYYHPLGFAYFPDGAHGDRDELEPGIVPPGSASTCDGDLLCPAPMYFENGVYLGEYSNLPNGTDIPVLPAGKAQVGSENFGLDDYEPKFFYPLGDWVGFGDFEVWLTFDVEDFTQDMFYFCHIHEFMTGRIKLVNTDGTPVNSEDTPEIEYEYDTADDFDKQCGTFNISDYQLPHPECPDRFVCDVESSEEGLAEFSECIDAMNCAMMVGMTSHAVSKTALFIHQMIPHHQNAVNMAKALLKTNDPSIQCDDLTEESDGCTMQTILREIINGQNAQIQSMRAILDGLDTNQYADCEVLVSDPGAGTSSASSHSVMLWMCLISAIIGLSSLT